MVMAPSAIDVNEENLINSQTKFKQLAEGIGNGHHGYSGSTMARSLVADALENRVKDIDGATCEADDENAFFIADMGDVYRQHLRWKRNLERIKPHYGKHPNFIHTRSFANPFQP